MFLATFRFVSDMVGNHEDRFSHEAAFLSKHCCLWPSTVGLSCCCVLKRTVEMKINGLMYNPLSFMIESDVHLLIKDVLRGLTVQKSLL